MREAEQVSLYEELDDNLRRETLFRKAPLS